MRTWEIVKELKSLINSDWSVEILESRQDFFSVRVNKCVFCTEIGVPCDLFKGFLVNSLEKSLPSEFRVAHFGEKNDTNDPLHNSFTVNLKIEKKY